MPPACSISNNVQHAATENYNYRWRRGNQSINQSINQSSEKSLDSLNKQAINQSINQSIKRSTNEQINQSINQSMALLTSRTSNCSLSCCALRFSTMACCSAYSDALLSSPWAWWKTFPVGRFTWDDFSFPLPPGHKLVMFRFNIWNENATA